MTPVASHIGVAEDLTSHLPSPIFAAWHPGGGRGTGLHEWWAGAHVCVQLNLREQWVGEHVHAYGAQLAQVELHVHVHTDQPATYMAQFRIDHGMVVGHGPGGYNLE